MTTRTGRFIPGVLTAFMLVPAALWGMDSRFELDLKSLGNGLKKEQSSPAAVSAAGATPSETVVKGTKKSSSRSKGKRSRSAVSRKDERHKVRQPERGYGLQLMGSPRAGNEGGMEILDRIWDELIPEKGQDRHAVELETGEFNLSLDPQKYPVISAADGGRILLDRDRSLPPLVKSLVIQNQPDIRIVSEDPANRHTFVKAVLDAANFYSVQDGFDVEFGADPKLIVHGDFKIEKNPDSLFRQDMVLLNVGEYLSPMPRPLVEFLKKEGFRVVESTLPGREGPARKDRGIYQISASDPAQIADSLMSALALPFDRNRSIDLPGFNDNGIRLKIRADRYFEDKGDRFVVCLFNGDPVRYTLVRLMETGGYRVIFLDPKDDLHSVAEKFISRLGLNGTYGVHRLWSGRDLPYAVEMSGMMVRDRGTDKSVLVTNRTIEPLARELVELNGYTVSSF